jgi:hypothetical protein
MPPLAHRGNSW